MRSFSFDRKLCFVFSGVTPRSTAGTPQRGSSATPGRASVRDKLNINPEESLEEYEAGYRAKEQQVRIL